MFKLTELDGKLVRVFYKKIKVNERIIFAPGKIEIFEKKQLINKHKDSDLDQAA